MILGVDTSEHVNDLPDALFDRLAAHGCGFLITRATRGLTHVDPSYERFQALAFRYGWLFGSFHFLEAGDGRLQAENYLATAQHSGLHVLDVEAKGLRWLMLVEFVERLRREGLRVGVYTSEEYWERFTRQRLDLFDYEWLADWREDIGAGQRNLSTWDLDPPLSPARLHQFGALKVSRVSDTTLSLDGNLWRGSREELLAL